MPACPGLPGISPPSGLTAVGHRPLPLTPQLWKELHPYSMLAFDPPEHSLSENQTANPFSPCTPFTTISLLFSTATNADSEAGPHDTLCRPQVHFSALYSSLPSSQDPGPTHHLEQQVKGRLDREVTKQPQVAVGQERGEDCRLEHRQHPSRHPRQARAACCEVPGWRGRSPERVWCEVGRWNNGRVSPGEPLREEENGKERQQNWQVCGQEEHIIK